MTEPFRVRFADQRHAAALKRDLGHLAGSDLQLQDGSWEVTIPGSMGDRDVVRVLNAIRSAMAGEAQAIARVLLNGREYELSGE